MILRELCMYLCGDWEKEGVDDKAARDRRLTSTRCVCTLVERLLGKKIRSDDTQKINLEWVPKVWDDRIITCDGIVTKQVAYDYKAYCDMDDAAKKSEVLRVIREEMGEVFLKKGLDYDVLMQACDEAERLNLENRWIAKKAKNNKSRSATAEIEVVHEVKTFTINAVFRNKKTGEIERNVLYETDRPDDYICYDYLGKFFWVSNDEIELDHKWTGKVMHAKCDII